MTLLPLILMTLCCVTLGNAEVLPHAFKNTGCDTFFFKGIEPSNGLMPLNAARICQRLNNKYHFATLYDRTNRIATYSAYIYNPGKGDRPDEWNIEPQLVGPKCQKCPESVNMIPERDARIEESVLKQSQAVDEDYKDSGYQRGHLNPALHNPEGSKIATCTLTNVVPQNAAFNQGDWNKFEEKTMKSKSLDCAESKTYVLVGAVPGKQYIANGRVNVPSHIWAAACCVLKKGGMKSWTVFAENNQSQIDETMTLGELEAKLKKMYNRGVILFHDDCPRTQ